MRNVVVGAVLVLAGLVGAPAVASAGLPWVWHGPYATAAQCEQGREYFEETGGVPTGCRYALRPEGAGWYFMSRGIIDPF